MAGDPIGARNLLLPIAFSTRHVHTSSAMKSILVLSLLVCFVALSRAAVCTSGTCKGPVIARYTDASCETRDAAAPYDTILNNAGEGGKCSTAGASILGVVGGSTKFSCGGRFTLKTYGPTDCSGKSIMYQSTPTGQCYRISSSRWGKVECAGAASFFVSATAIVVAVFAFLLI